MVNGIDDLAVTNIDGLDTVETKVCIGYRDGKKKYDYTPNDVEVQAARCGEPAHGIAGLGACDARGPLVEVPPLGHVVIESH